MSYPPYNYYPQPYPQTPHPVPNGYQQYYQQGPPHPPHIPAAPVPYDQYSVPYPTAAVGHPIERPRSHRRSNTVPLRPALKHPTNSLPAPATDANNLTRQRTNSAGHNALSRTRTQSNPKQPDFASGRDSSFVPGATISLSSST